MGPWCIACIQQSGPADRYVCNLCMGYVATYWRCPRCQRIEHYYAHDEPKICECGFVLPSVEDLKSLSEARVMYQIAEEMYD
jgi:hypothetical protein